MNNTSVVFGAPHRVSIASEEFSPTVSEGELLVKKLYSLISTGTELACLSGGESWFQMPGVPGYCCVSEVIESGSARFTVGEMLFHYGAHSRYQLIRDDEFVVRVPEGLDCMAVPMVRMATIALTAVRVSDIELGDHVIVTGLGLVGNMAAQLAKLSGATVIGIDPSPNRRDLALACGIDFALPDVGANGEIQRLTAGRGAHTVIEATGIPQVAQGVLDSIGYHGELILLGTPRGEYQANLAEVLRHCHVDGLGSITFKGAHEWRLPLIRDKYVKHSIERNTEVCMDLIGRGDLRVRELISKRIAPREAPAAYMALNADRNAYLGVVIDWTKE